MKKAVLLVLLGAFLSPVMKVHSQVQRVEIEAKVGSDNIRIVPAGKNGVLVFAESGDKVKTSEGKSRVWNVTLYGTDFSEKWSDEVYLNKKVDLIRYEYKDGFLYALFGEKDQQMNEIHAIKLDVVSGQYKDVQGKIPNMETNGFSVHGDNMVFAGNTYPSPGQAQKRLLLTYCGCFIPAIFGSLNFPIKPVVYIADFNSGQLKLNQVPTEHRGSIKDIQYSENEEKYYSISLEQSKKKYFSTKLNRHNSSGKFEDDYTIKSKNNNILVNGRLVEKSANEKLLIGSFSKPRKEKKGKKDKWGRVNSVEGLYFTTFQDGKQKYIKYYDFTDMENYVKFIQTYNYGLFTAKGKAMDVAYLLLIHEIIEQDDQYIFVGESYYPEYHYEYYTDANGNTHSRRVFDGYRYTHALVTGFDHEGNLLWDHSFNIENILTFNLTEKVKVLTEGDDVVLAYAYGGYIQSKIIRGSEILEGESSMQLDTEFSSDKVKKNYRSEVEFWYDEYFLASGYQKIKNKKKKGEDRKRKVFYFNKVGYK